MSTISPTDFDSLEIQQQYNDINNRWDLAAQETDSWDNENSSARLFERSRIKALAVVLTEMAVYRMLQLFRWPVMASVLLCVCSCGPIITGGDTSNLSAGSVDGATLDTVGEVEKRKLACFSATDPHSALVNHVYDQREDTGFLWRGNRSDILPCHNTVTPASSRCVPCALGLKPTILFVCKDVPETVHLEMETDGGSLDNVTAVDCPSFTKPAADPAVTPLGPTLDAPKEQQQPELSTDDIGQVPWWGWLIIVISIIVAAGALSFLVFWKQKKDTPETPAGDEDRPMNGHALSELSPMMNGDSVDKPDGT